MNKLKHVIIVFAFILTCILLLGVIPISYSESRFSIDGKFIASITATRYGHFGLNNNFDSVIFTLSNKDKSITQKKYLT